MRTALTAVAVGAALLFAGLYGAAHTRPERAPAPVQRIEEDSPLWDCHTMGNRVCGGPSIPDVTPSD